MRLTELLSGLAAVERDMEITGLALDSRVVEPGDAFIALAGSKQHGLLHARQAFARGACAILYEASGGGAELASEWQDTPLLAVDGLAGKLGEVAARYFGDPSAGMNVIGITGTNGKTSCSQFLSQLLPACGIIGTLGWGEWGSLHKTHNTTPDALAVQRILADLRRQNKRTVAMEVSSHGLEQGRVNGVHFRGAIFTNISRDHLDYHGTMEAYVAAKLLLLRQPGLEFAVVNLDDEYGAEIVNAAPAEVAVWGVSRRGRRIGRGEAITAENIRHGTDGIEFELCWRGNRMHAFAPLFGDFNIDNCLSVLGVMLARGESPERAVGSLRLLEPVPGRMQRFGDGGQPAVFVDYAHTPDALDKVLASARQHCAGQLWVVFGCGGNRDKGKRAEMGASASRWADHIIVTDDNPRHENGEEIVKDILGGCRKEKLRVIRDRAGAIQAAVTGAGPGDWIVVAGKGHEDYQEIAGIRYPFSDAETVATALKMRTINGEHAVQ